jgi:hypothetical protein
VQNLVKILGYTTFSYTHSKLIIDPTPRTTESVNISAIVDDTNCVSDSQSNLEQILAIAQGFYGFTNIIVNHSKAMVRSNSLDYRSRHHIAHWNSAIPLPNQFCSDKSRIYVKSQTRLKSLQYSLVQNDWRTKHLICV